MTRQGSRGEFRPSQLYTFIILAPSAADSPTACLMRFARILEDKPFACNVCNKTYSEEKSQLAGYSWLLLLTLNYTTHLLLPYLSPHITSRCLQDRMSCKTGDLSLNLISICNTCAHPIHHHSQYFTSSLGDRLIPIAGLC